MTKRDEVAWAICPSIREYSCGEDVEPTCQRCPEMVTCSEGEGIQACRHAANVAADRVLALSPPEPTEDLLPCPFCGEPPKMLERTGEIFCGGQDCFGPVTTAGNIADSTIQWNKRAALT